MPKRLFSFAVALILLFTLSVSAFAARRFSQSKFDSLPTWDEKAAYVNAIDEWYNKNTNYTSADGMPQDVYDDQVALMNARGWLNENPPGATTKLQDGVSDRIAAIKKTYGIEFTIGGNEDGKYHQDAKIGPHLTAIESGLSYMGAALTKKLAADFGATKFAQDEARDVGHIYPWRGKFRINLTPKQDVYNTDGSLEGFVSKYSRGLVYLGGNNTKPVISRTVVHEFGHALMETLYADNKGFPPDVFHNSKYGNYGSGSGFIGSYDASKHPDYFVSSYAQRNFSEDYADTFAVAVINGGDNPLKYGKDTVVYQKVLTIYNDLLEYAGSGSSATKRVGAYIGIKPEK